jgi:Putative redox-active protein (C_GCAxxG_C_C)
VPGEDLALNSAATLRRRSVGNLLRMGHCAPTVMKTLLDASGSTARWPVLLTAGLPGGIGNTGGECGGLTAPLVLLGLEYGRGETEDGLPVVVEAGHDLLARFADTQGTTQCREIRGTSRVPLRCIGVVREAPVTCAACMEAPRGGAVAPEARVAYQRLYEHWTQRGFHCADAVLRESGHSSAPDEELRDAVTAFMGGTLFAGMTCSALTAGVMALGLALGEIENSHTRVARMIATMAVRGDAFADELNAFNRLMNLGHELSVWFEAEFGSTQCRALTRCDFASTADVDEYIDRDGTADCARLARRVAEHVSAMVERSSTSTHHDETGPIR